MSHTSIVSECITNSSGDEVWKNEECQLHREDGPAIIYADGQKQWYINGLLHREDGPAFESPRGTKKWYINGKLHREDGPAVIYSNGKKLWMFNGKRMDPMMIWMIENSNKITTTET